MLLGCLSLGLVFFVYVYLQKWQRLDEGCMMVCGLEFRVRVGFLFQREKVREK